jgi:hypothetical protein
MCSLGNDHHEMADGDDEEGEYSPGLWWLAIAPHSSRLLLVHTHGVTEGLDYRSYDDYRVADNIVDHHSHTIATYSTTGFGCQVFSMETSRLSIPPRR